jgi:Carboxypeptidase regulatory-like domain
MKAPNLWLLIMVWVVAGCGRSEPPVALSGIVRQAGSPLSQIEVVFAAANGKEYFRAITDSEGRFQLPGVPAGRYAVLLREPSRLDLLAGKQEPGLPGNPARHAAKMQTIFSRVPKVFASLESTPLRDVLVAPEKDRHEFNIPDQ